MAPAAELKTIARIHSVFREKFGIPHQSGIVDSLRATIEFEAEYRNPDALRGLETFSHIWLLWGFSRAEREAWSPTVRPPKLGGNTRMGVFATRSPYRPNAIGLSSVRIEAIDPNPANPLIHVLGADLMDGSPIYDIKPYLPFTDSHPEAKGGFTENPAAPRLRVSISESLLSLLPPQLRGGLHEVLSRDPRPQYQDDPERVYGMLFGEFDIKFTVNGNLLTVRDIVRSGGN